MVLLLRKVAAVSALTSAILVLVACSSPEPESTESASSPPPDTAVPTEVTGVSSEPQPAGPEPDAYEDRETDGIRYLTSFRGAGDAVAHEVVASVGGDGCLYFETIGFGTDPQTWFAVMGDPSFEVTSEGLLIDAVTVPFGTAFAASTSAIPPVDQVPAGYAEQCTGAEQLWSVAP